MRIENLHVPNEQGELTVYDVEFVDRTGIVAYGEQLEVSSWREQMPS